MLAEFPVARENEMINELGAKDRKFACRDVRSCMAKKRAADEIGTKYVQPAHRNNFRRDTLSLLMTSKSSRLSLYGRIGFSRQRTKHYTLQNSQAEVFVCQF